DLVLDGTAVAPTHAVIDAGANGAVLRAVGSFPLYLNGQPIIAAPLRHGDLISVGDLRVMVELRAATNAQPEKRPRLQLIENETDPEPAPTHLPPSLAVVREREPGLHAVPEGRGDFDIHPAIADLPAPQPMAPEAPAQLPSPAQQAAPAMPAVPAKADEPARLPAPPAPVVPLRGLPPLQAQAVQGGECVEAELFWGRTRLSVW